uniref:CSON012519 protein n=1 Tax=Culicoides sonorensis TaxID=179676 RepID=A0A336LMF5_CULSO
MVISTDPILFLCIGK